MSRIEARRRYLEEVRQVRAFDGPDLPARCSRSQDDHVAVSRWLRDAADVTEPRRAIVAADIGLCGLWRVMSRDEFLAPAPPGRWSGQPPARSAASRPRAWSEYLSVELLDDLQEWNDAWDCDGPDVQALEERGHALAVRVQEQLGADRLQAHIGYRQAR